MTPFIGAEIPRSEIDQSIRDLITAWKNGNGDARKLVPFTTEPEAIAYITATINRLHDGKEQVFLNDTYQVNIREAEVGEGWPRMLHVSIKRRDKQPIHDWRDLQRIKNELIGEDYEAVELYPAERRLVDTSNQFHLWVLADRTMQFPFGFTGPRCTLDGSQMFGKAVQRPRNDNNNHHHQP